MKRLATLMLALGLLAVGSNAHADDPDFTRLTGQVSEDAAKVKAANQALAEALAKGNKTRAELERFKGQHDGIAKNLKVIEGKLKTAIDTFKIETAKLGDKDYDAAKVKDLESEVTKLQPQIEIERGKLTEVGKQVAAAKEAHDPFEEVYQTALKASNAAPGQVITDLIKELNEMKLTTPLRDMTNLRQLQLEARANAVAGKLDNAVIGFYLHDKLAKLFNPCFIKQQGDRCHLAGADLSKDAGPEVKDFTTPNERVKGYFDKGGLGGHGVDFPK